MSRGLVAYWEEGNYQDVQKKIETSAATKEKLLDLSFQQLTHIPLEIERLTKLEELDLSNNRLVDFPSVLTSLTNLRVLDLSNNYLTEIPIEISRLHNLKKLYVSFNQLSKIPSGITQLIKLEELHWRNNQLNRVPQEIDQLKNLKTLYLRENRITTLPKKIFSLGNLEKLYISHNAISKLPPAIGKLHELRVLDVSFNDLLKLPPEIAHLHSLKELDISNNRISTLPVEITQLTNLQTLRLFRESSSKQEFLGQRKYSNRLAAPCYTVQSQSNSSIEVGEQRQQNIRSPHRNNPLHQSLIKAYEEGIESLFTYLRAKVDNPINLYEAKLILIGEGGVGKTCLLGALRKDQWCDEHPSTHGIEIKPFTVSAPDQATDIRLNGWDFGGQRVYRPTHQLFFSAPAVYLVVWKPRDGVQQGFVKEWISLITHREPSAKILVVATHGGPGQRQPDLDQQELIDQFGSTTICGFYHVDSKPDSQNQPPKGIEELRHAIAQIASKLPEMGQSVPGKWKDAHEVLRRNRKPYRSYKEVIKIATSLDIPKNQATLFLKISHELGYLTHYHQDPILKNIVILKPDWLAKAISFVLDNETIRTNSGLADFTYLQQIWRTPPFEEEEGYPEALHPIFLRLMERFDLSYKVILDPHHPSNTSLIAQLVPDRRPESKIAIGWPTYAHPWDRQQTQICRIIDEKRQTAKAEGLFYQLIVRLHKYSLGRYSYNDSIHWQRGVVLDNDYNGRALLEHIGNDIRITVRAAYPERFLSYLTQEITWLIENFWEGLRCQIMVPCLSLDSIEEPCAGLLEAAKLIDSKRKNHPEYPCDVCGEWQNIDQLLSNAPLAQPNTQTQKLEELQHEIKAVGQLVLETGNRLSQGQEALLSQSDEQFNTYMQMLTDEAKEGPRLFSIKPVKTKFLDTNPSWVTAKFEITLWCEHSVTPLPELNPDNPKLGVYQVELEREWITTMRPWLKPIATVLSAVAPAAIAATKLNLSDDAYKRIDEQIGMTQQTMTLASKGVTDTLAVKGDRGFDRRDSIRAQGAVLRKLHAQIKAKDPSFGGLERVQNRRHEFLWVHKQFVTEY